METKLNPHLDNFPNRLTSSLQHGGVVYNSLAIQDWMWRRASGQCIRQLMRAYKRRGILKILYSQRCYCLDVALFQIKKHCHRRYKYTVQRVRRRQDHIKHAKLAEALLQDPNCNFWSEVHRDSLVTKNISISSCSKCFRFWQHWQLIHQQPFQPLQKYCWIT